MTRLTRRLITSLIGVSALALGAWPMAALASTAPGLGTATSFAVLAGTTVTNTGDTVITGDLGVNPGPGTGPPVTGFPPGIVNGTQFTATDDALAIRAKTDLTTAYNNAAAAPCQSDRTGQDLGGGQTLGPGIYCYTSEATLTRTLILDGDGVYIFKIGSTLITAPGATVSLNNDAQPCNVFWQVGSSATLDTTTTFVGTIMALTSITLNTGANLAGRALARNGAVTLDTNTITAPSCNAVPNPTSRPSASPTASPSASPSASPIGSPVASPIGSPVASPLGSPVASHIASPTPRPAARLATTGGGPPEGSPWMLMVIVVGLGAVGLGLSVRARRRSL